jgi:hypothetical protein
MTAAVTDVSRLEQYLFADGNKEEFFKTLVPGTLEHDWFHLLHALNTKGSLSSDEQKQLKTFCDAYGQYYSEKR